MFTASSSKAKLTLKDIDLNNGPKYGIQAYEAGKVILNNVGITGFKYGGILVNGGYVEIIDLHLGYNGTVANNGIEIDQGASVKNTPTLVMNGTLTSDSTENVIRPAENAYLTEFIISNTESTLNKVVIAGDKVVLTDENDKVISETTIPEKVTPNVDESAKKVIITLIQGEKTNRITVNDGDTITKKQLDEYITIESNKNETGISEETERMAKIKKLQEENSDIAGWSEIEGTNINYPVLQGKDDEYYLTHNYKKEKSQKGSIFLSKDYDLKLPSDNLLIYGHNLISGQMFNNLLKYKDREFYEKHPNIRFTTAKEDLKFEIISAFYSKVFLKSEENVFRYYNFVTAKSEKDYNNFVENAKKASIYATNKEAEYGDRLITLVTCSYHVEDGRFVVIGVVY